MVTVRWRASLVLQLLLPPLLLVKGVLGLEISNLLLEETVELKDGALLAKGVVSVANIDHLSFLLELGN